MRSLLRMLNNEWGCFGGTPKAPSIQQAPAPAPTPQILPSEVSAQSSEQTRRRQIDRLRLGIYSTLKAPLGQTGQGAELAGNTQGKKELG